MTCVCGGRKPVKIRKFYNEGWHAEVDHDGWVEGGWFKSWADALDWAWWRLS